MLSWRKRPIEVANLFNPAFCGVLLQKYIRSYQKERDTGSPYALLFLVLPIVLHQTTRLKLPNRSTTKMHVWLQNNPEVRINFAIRARNLVPHTKEAISFGLDTQIISIEDTGQVVWVPKKLRNPQSNSELSTFIRKSELIGTWFARSEADSVFTMWGVRP